MTKLKLETGLNIIPLESKIKVLNKIEDLGGSENLIFNVYDGKNIIGYGINNKSIIFYLLQIIIIFQIILLMMKKMEIYFYHIIHFYIF